MLETCPNGDLRHNKRDTRLLCDVFYIKTHYPSKRTIDTHFCVTLKNLDIGKKYHSDKSKDIERNEVVAPKLRASILEMGDTTSQIYGDLKGRIEMYLRCQDIKILTVDIIDASIVAVGKDVDKLTQILK